MAAATTLTGEHAEDVLAQLLGWRLAGLDCALVFVTSTEGGAVRAPGALLAVGPQHSIGYISGGCIDADVELQARAAITEGQARSLRYGAGSPFVDLPLPCGGAIEVLIIPTPDNDVIQAAHQALCTRQPVTLIASPEGSIAISSKTTPPKPGDHVFSYAPKLRLRIAGRGADALALAKLSDAAGYATRLQLIDEEDIVRAKSIGLESIEALQTPTQLSGSDDDAWTAFVLLFHDSDWEVPLLRQALDGDAFYIGAVGSKRTHLARCEALRASGCDDEQVSRVQGPIGLVPSLRDASMLAISTLAEIVDQFPGKSSSRRARTALLMLAAGTSSRYEAGDKLLADLEGRTVLDWSASRLPLEDDFIKVAVVPSETSERSGILQKHGWSVIENTHAAHGQSTSVKQGIEAISQMADIDQVIIMLADMPFIPASHLGVMRRAADNPSCSALMTEADGTLCPPALFKREHFSALTGLSGDQGAKSVFLKLGIGSQTCALAKDLAVDIDNLADLARVKEATHA